MSILASLLKSRAPRHLAVNLVPGAQTNFNLYSYLNAQHGYNGKRPIVCNVVVNAKFQSNSTATPAFAIDGNIPPGSRIYLRIDAGAEICGKGGAGGASESAGGNGGHALYVTATGVQITIENAGEINGGGGGGGGGAGCRTCWNGGCKTQSDRASAGGLGGAGYGPSGATSGAAGLVCSNNACGTDGTGGTGGGGGGKGTIGAAGAPCTTGDCASCGSPGGAGNPGAAVVGDSAITWFATGTRNGAIVP